MKQFKSVNEYIASQPAVIQKKLKQLRRLIKKLAPKAEEKISYGMPAYKLGSALVYFGGYNNHIGFYAMPSAVRKFKKELASYSTSKSAIRFPLDNPLPVALIEQILIFRVQENAAKAVAKKAKK